jgi:hypothetical protein
MHVHDTLQSEYFGRNDRPAVQFFGSVASPRSQLICAMRKSRQLCCTAAISMTAAAGAPKLLAGDLNLS